MIRIKRLAISNNNTKQCKTDFYNRTYLCKTHYDTPENKESTSTCNNIAFSIGINNSDCNRTDNNKTNHDRTDNNKTNHDRTDNNKTNHDRTDNNNIDYNDIAYTTSQDNNGIYWSSDRHKIIDEKWAYSNLHNSDG